MRIALVAASPNIIGGHSVQAQALAAGFRDAGHEVSYVPIDPTFPRGLRWLRSLPYARTLLNEALYIASLHRFSGADIVHVFSASYWSFLLAPAPAIVAARLLRKPVVLHYHSGEASDHLARWRRSVAPFLRMVDEIVVPSSWLQSIFEAHGYRARVIPNVIDPYRFVYRERWPVRPRLISVRNLESHYRIDNTINAFAHLKIRFPEATLTIAGYGGQERDLRRMVSELGVDGVEFIGRIDPAALPAIYDDAHIFLNSSAVDNQPVSILEAFASGLPVVSTPTGDIGAMLCGGDAGLTIDPDDPAAMVAAVARLLEEPDLALRTARRARREVERYTWPVVSAMWTKVYSNVLAHAAAHEEHENPVPSFLSRD